MTSTPAGKLRSAPGRWLFLGIGFWVGFNLRAPLLGVPPVLASLRTSLGLNYLEAGLVTSLPILAFAALALPSSALVRRWGGWGIVLAGLALAAAGELLRVAPGGVFPLMLGTAAMGVGIAATQPGLPAMLQSWFGHEVQLGSVMVTLGITVGEMVAASITGPLLLPWLGGWQATMLLWALVAATCVPLWWLVVPASKVGRAVQSRGGVLEMMRSTRLIPVYVMFGGQSFVFFASNTWIPSAVPGGPHSATAAICLATLNGVMIPVNVALILLRRQFATRRWFYALGASITLLGAAGWLWAGASVPELWTALLGIGVALTFAGLMAYAPLMAAPSRVSVLSATMLTVGYSLAFLGPLLGGLALDLGGGRRSPFIPVLLAAAAMLFAALRGGYERAAPVLLPDTVAVGPILVE